ncbi:MAG: heat-shock protein Hsp20 [Roseinatronobacter sp.]|uniref:HSP20 family molecular chaperone IbpA n=1 Tax=Roseinatronobacter monicus TaxID=393481 RepID=A0A543KAB6_9RHOB|nr:Hsp20 family protein [Roseinatronobacter monicus]TQM92020.1 HSP20 family molecular chaperone IbpA [Roseinatronobacter monicus]TVQ03473.1 MAG: heat-shock protein Hsp20 [Roseinatronobacter sp.]
MTKLNFPSHPLLLGFDRLERLVERTARAGTDGYPPFNIEVTEQNKFRITLALAGFREEDLSITVEKRQLLVHGQQHDTDKDTRVFLHRGIAARQFQRAFALADGVDVAQAWLADGLLHIDLIRKEPEDTVQTVPITRG